MYVWTYVASTWWSYQGNNFFRADNVSGAEIEYVNEQKSKTYRII